MHLWPARRRRLPCLMVAGLFLVSCNVGQRPAAVDCAAQSDKGCLVFCATWRAELLARRLEVEATTPEGAAQALGSALWRQTVLTDLVHEQLILRQASRQHLLWDAGQKSQAVEAAWARLTHGWTPEALREELQARGHSEASLRAALGRQLQVQRYLRQEVYARVHIPDAEVLEDPRAQAKGPQAARFLVSSAGRQAELRLRQERERQAEAQHMAALWEAAGVRLEASCALP